MFPASKTVSQKCAPLVSEQHTTCQACCKIGAIPTQIPYALARFAAGRGVALPFFAPHSPPPPPPPAGALGAGRALPLPSLPPPLLPGHQHRRGHGDGRIRTDKNT